MEQRFTSFAVFVLLSIITLGLYPLYFYVTRTQEVIDVLREVEKNTAPKVTRAKAK
jgi:hypothetical protein